MHKEILTKEQVSLLPLVKAFKDNFNLVGGTAIALHLGHRHSIDFDMFSFLDFKNSVIRRKVRKFANIDTEIVSHTGEFTFMCKEVKFTFYHYPFDLEYKDEFEGIKMPDLLTLAAMKAHALAGRAKWKDYVDLFFIMKDFYSMQVISEQAARLFKGEFNGKLFRIQLAFFDDVNYEEKVEFMPGYEVPEEEIKRFLTEASLS